MLPLLLAPLAALAQSPPVDLGPGALVPDRPEVRLQAAHTVRPDLVGFSTLEGATPWWSSPASRVSLGVTASAGLAANHAIGEARGGVGPRKVGGGLWVVLSTPEAGQRHALGIVAAFGQTRWFRWHPDEADTGVHLAWESWIPLTERLSLRGSTWIGANRVHRFGFSVHGDAMVVVHPHEAFSVGVGGVAGVPGHLQAVVSLTWEVTAAVDLGTDLQLPLLAPAGWVAPSPTLGARVRLATP